MVPSDFSVQHKAKKKFGTFQYELQPTREYLFSLFQFYSEEEEKIQAHRRFVKKDVYEGVLPRLESKLVNIDSSLRVQWPPGPTTA